VMHQPPALQRASFHDSTGSQILQIMTATHPGLIDNDKSASIHQCPYFG
jgi:hypothetical protein